MRIALTTDTYEPQVNGVTTVLRRIVDLVSRVTLKVHHVGDVVAGAVLGLVGAIGARAILF